MTWPTKTSSGLFCRLVPDGTVLKTRLDRTATNIAVPAATGVRRDGQKMLLFLKNMAGESKAAGGMFLGDRGARGQKQPEFVIVDGAPGLEAALVALWGEALPIQRCTVHKHRNLLGHAPKHMHDELSEDYRDMIHADTAADIEKRRKAVLRKWHLNCRAVADSLEEVGDRLFTFTRLDPAQWKSVQWKSAQWKSARTTNAIERLTEEFRRRIKTQTGLPCAETVPMRGSVRVRVRLWRMGLPAVEKPALVRVRMGAAAMGVHSFGGRAWPEAVWRALTRERGVGV